MTITIGKSQTIKSLYDDSFSDFPGAYFKDIYNDLDRFVGTWKYTDGNTSLEVVLQKKEMVFDYELEHYTDEIIGEYKYIENGNLIVNTLPNLQINYDDFFEYNIAGTIIYKTDSNEVGIRMTFSDPEREIFGAGGVMSFLYRMEDGVEKLNLNVRLSGSTIMIAGEEPAYTSYRVPFGRYVLIKQ